MNTDVSCSSRNFREAYLGLIRLSLVLLSSALFFIPQQAHAAPPTGFAVEQLITGLQQPIAMRFLPDERLLVIQKKGVIRIVDVFDTPTPSEVYMNFADPSHPSRLNAGNERGVLDVAVDPDFPAQPYLYFLYTPAFGLNGEAPKLRVSRYTHLENTGLLSSRMDVNSEVVLWEDTQGYDSCCHFGGGIDFGPDGNLWFTTGDHFQGSYAASPAFAGGGVHRIAKDGSIPDGNPFKNDTGPNVKSLVALGLRNPFRCSWDLEANRLYIGEVGGNTQSIAWEDLHIIDYVPGVGGAPGRIVDADFGTAGDDGVFDLINFGWPSCEGLPPHVNFPSCNIDTVGEPLFAYEHTGDTAAITGGEVYRKNQFPQEFEGAYFYADSTRDFIRYLKFNSDGSVASNPNPAPLSPLSPDLMSYPFDLDPTGRIVDLTVGPDGALYFINFTDAGGAFGQSNPTVAGSVGRYVFDGGNSRPVISNFSVTPDEGPSPLPVTFTIEALDPELSAMTYTLFFGDGQTSGAPQPLPQSSPIQLSHNYAADGVYEALIDISDGERRTTQRISVRVGTPPTILTLTSDNDRPGADDTTFRFGDTITFAATASDVEEGNLGGDSFSWDVIFVRPGNVHPALGPVENQASIDFPIPSQGQGFRGPVFYRCFLTVTDASGLSTTSTIDVFPEKADISFDTVPSGIAVQVDGNTVEETPFVLDTLVNFPHVITVPSVQCRDGIRYEFTGWSNGVNTPQQVYPVPETNTSLVANYIDTGVCSEAPTNGLVMRLKGDTGVVINGTDVLSWADQSGNGNDVISLGEPQLIFGALNGLSVVQFDGIDDAMTKTGFNNLPLGSDDRSVFMLARFLQNGGGSAWSGVSYGLAQNNQTFGLTLTPAGSLGLQGWGGNNDFETTPSINGIGRWLNYGVIYSGQNFAQYDNGTPVGTGAHVFNTSEGGIRIAEDLKGNRNLNMEIAEILVYDRAVSEAERLQIESYFEETYAIDVSRGALPVVEISSPENSSVFEAANGAVTFTATASDQEDGDLTASIVWNSDIDGFLGTGASVASVLSAGVHQITASAEDSDNLETVAEIFILVSDESAAALVTDGLVFQLESDLNVALQSGSTVAAWLDQSGLGNDVIAGGEPELVLNATPSGLPAITFDGVDDKLERVAASEPIGGIPGGSAPRTMMMVARYESASAWAGVTYGEGDSNRAFGLAVRPNDGTLGVQGWGSGNDLSSSEPGVGAGWLTQSVVYDGGITRLYRGGFEIADFAHSYNTSLNKLVIGEEISGLGSVAMDVAGIFIYDRVLTPSERLTMESYLAQKFLAPQTATAVTINQPADGESFFEEGTIQFAATLGADAPAGSTLAWTSSIDGDIGAGDLLSLSDLSVGHHLITVTALNQGSFLGTAGIFISVESLNQSPQVVIGGPADAAMKQSGVPINFVAGAFDAEDGVLSGALQWESNLDGSLGIGTSIIRPLSVGQHIITASVTDSEGAVGSDSITLSVSNPSPGALVTSGLVVHLESDASVSTLPDGTTVSEWIDQSGLGNTVMADGSPQLLTNGTPSGLPAISLDGVADKLERLDSVNSISGLPLGNDDRTMIIVAKYNSSQAWGGVAYGTGAVNQAFGAVVRHPLGQLVLQGWGGGNDLISSESGIGSGWLTQSAVLDGGEGILYKGNQELKRFTHNYATSLTKLVIGEEISEAGKVGMEIAAVLIYDRVLTEQERTNVWDYLESKYLRVEDADSGPELTINAPDNGSIFDDNEVVNFFATARNVGTSAQLCLPPIDDVYLEDGDNRNNTNLRVENSPSRERITYLKFDLTELPESPLSAVAALRLTESSDTSSGNTITLNIYRGVNANWTPGENNWSETTLDEDDPNLPQKDGAPIGSFTGVISDNTIVEFDLASVVTAPGIYTFIIEMEASESANDVAFGSKDGGFQPAILKVTLPHASDSIQWTSSLDGPIGIGGVISKSDLSRGTHEILAELDLGGDPPVVLSERIITTISDLQSDGLPVQGGLVLHLESDMMVSTSQTSEVTSWLDQSGQGNDLFAAGDPELINGETPSGEAAIRLDGLGDKLARIATANPINGFPSGNDDRSIFAVVNYRGASAWAGAAFGRGAPNAAFGVVTNTSGKQTLQGWGRGNDLQSSGLTFDQEWIVQSGVHHAGQATLYGNGSQLAQFNHVYNTVLDQIVLGEEISGAGFADMDVAAVLIFDRALSSTERARVEAYLQEKYLLTEEENAVTVGNAPTVQLNEVGPIVHEAGAVFVDPEALLIDSEDGSKVIAASTPLDVFSLGVQTLTYEGEDSDGNYAVATMNVEVVDTTPAEIVVPFKGPIIHMLGEPFVDPNATAFDQNDGTANLVSSTSVDGSVPGRYVLTYQHTDLAGNQSPPVSVSVFVIDFSQVRMVFSRPVDPVNPDDLQISFPTSRRFSYTVQYTTNLRQWNSVETYQGTGGLIHCIHPGALNEQRLLYRLRIRRNR